MLDLNPTVYREYAILSSDASLAAAITWADHQRIDYQLHLNRTRFLIPTGARETEFLLRFNQAFTVKELRSYG